MFRPRIVRVPSRAIALSRPFSRKRVTVPIVAHRLRTAQAVDNDDSTDDTDLQDLQNKLQIPADSLAYIAGAWQGSPSKVPADLLASVADLPMTKGASQATHRSGSQTKSTHCNSFSSFRFCSSCKTSMCSSHCIVLADVPDYQTKAEGLQNWRAALQKGRLPRDSTVEFPVEPFKTKFLVWPPHSVQTSRGHS